MSHESAVTTPILNESSSMTMHESQSGIDSAEAPEREPSGQLSPSSAIDAEDTENEVEASGIGDSPDTEIKLDTLKIYKLLEKAASQRTSDGGDLFSDILDVDLEIFKALTPGLPSRDQHQSLRNRQTMTYFAQLEQRLSDLFERVDKLDNRKKPVKDGKSGGKSLSEGEKWMLSPGWKTVEQFVKSDSEMGWPRPIVDVLPEPMRSFQESGDEARPPGVDPADIDRKPLEQLEKREIHRIKINSYYVNGMFAEMMQDEREPQSFEMHLRPFKALLTFDHVLRSRLIEMEKRTGKVEGEIDDQDSGEPTKAEKHQLLKSNHLRAYLDFVDRYLKHELASFRLLRSPESHKQVIEVSLSDLWKFFAPGDTIYEPTADQAYHLIAVGGGRQILRNPGRDPPNKQDRAAPKQGDYTDFKLTCLRLDFDGRKVGPVQEEIFLKPFNGLRPITSLEAYPIRYADIQRSDQHASTARPDTSSGEDTLQRLRTRGQKFSQLARKMFFHKDYQGLSRDDRQEQIDSEVIIDLEKYYTLFYLLRPPLGLREVGEADYRECLETIQKKRSDVFRPSELALDLYDDRKIDAHLKDQALKEIPDIVGWRSTDENDLRDKHCHLFPRDIQGFVLKSRKWVLLDIDSIAEIQNKHQSFENLILPPRHKDIVQSLVEKHSLGPKIAAERAGGPTSGVPAANVKREDLIRGKGKGLIVLLHGVPGVGKTSTAECVAEHTNRPLYALTCGDVGEDPATVEENLQSAFSLAYRWGCVMLLDEADVFLARRTETDMKRNGVVSVFLRSLEYYSGILFLTTNKVGVFDEAFTSRINISLYYKPLSRTQTLKIWKVNIGQIKEVNPDLNFDEGDLLSWVKKSWRGMKKDQRRPWNGRQIHNAVRTAAALAAFDIKSKNTLTTVHLKAIDKASKAFDRYLEYVHGTDEFGRAEQYLDRADDKFNTPRTQRSSTKPSKGMSSKKSKKKPRSPPSSGSSEEEDEKSESESDSESGSESD